MDEEKQVDPEQQKKQEEQDASKKALKTGAKAGAQALGSTVGAGQLAGKAFDLASNTKLGNAALDKGAKLLNQNPMIGKVANAANKSGAIDAVDKGLDATSGGGLGKGENPLPNKSAEIKVPNDKEQDSKPSQKSGLSSPLSNNSEEESEGESSSNDPFELEGFLGDPKKKLKLIVMISSLLFFALLLIIPFIVVYGPLEAAKEYFSNTWNNFVGLFTGDESAKEKSYYDKLKEVQTKVNSAKGVCIDINLINVTLTINRMFDDLIEDIDKEEFLERDILNEDGSTGKENLQFKKMEKQIELLANMQIMTKKYGLDDGFKNATGSYCADSSFESLVTQENASNFNGKYFWQNGVDSSSFELIARHDEVGFSAFWKKKADEETNKAYYLYHPEFTIVYDYNSDGTVKLDANGNPIVKSKTCSANVPPDEYSLSIGDYKTRKESVYYWNLVNSFIPEYYDDYLPKEETERNAKIIEMADNIYLLYEDVGPNKICNINYAYNGSSSLCPNGVTVIAGTNDSGYNRNPDLFPIGVFDLDEYVGMVLNGENNSGYDEAMKAQIIAARTYTLIRTNNCTQPIRNSTEDQVARANPSDKIKQLVSETRGQVLTYQGETFLSEYDSFHGACDEDTCTATYTKQPNGEIHVVTVPKSFHEGLGGHGRGMSQVASNYLASTGYTYEQILKYFYSDGVEITTVSGASSTDGAFIASNGIGQVLENSGSSIETFNQYIFNQVRNNGVSTRNGVVAAAISLTSGLYERTGYILPYELYPSGKYGGYGIDSTWGTNTGRSDYPSQGLDCSGFISWAIHNGGYQYQLINAQGWGNQGTSRSWSKGTVDNKALPGDLIYNRPPSNNGTSGHIRMIVGVEKDGYLVAEAGSGKTGVRMTKISFQSTGNYYLVDMTNYYNDPNRFVSDYPS